MMTKRMIKMIMAMEIAMNIMMPMMIGGELDARMMTMMTFSRARASNAGRVRQRY